MVDGTLINVEQNFSQHIVYITNLYQNKKKMKRDEKNTKKIDTWQSFLTLVNRRMSEREN